MHGWFRDARYAIRQLRRTPTFTLTAIITLALGIGANSTIFSWMNSTLFSPVPGANPKSTLIAMTRPGDRELSYLDYQDLRSHTRSLTGLIGWDVNPVNLTGSGKPQRLWAALTTENYFDVLGIKPVLGRFFQPQEGQTPGDSPVVVLGYRTWQMLFSGDSKIIGRIINLNQHPYTVIGIAPPLFQGASNGLRMDLWVPFMMQNQLEAHDKIHDRGYETLGMLGTLAPGASRGDAQQELTLEMRQIASAFPQQHRGDNDIVTYPMWRAPNSANGYLYRMFPPLVAIAFVVLLLACVNVANLFLVRAVARRREMAVRLSLGANRTRLVRQLLVESVLVALAGGGLATLFTFWSSRSFDRFIPPTDVPIAIDMRVDGRVLAVTFALSTLTGIAFGLLPALRSSRIMPIAVLKEEAGTTSSGKHKARLTSTLVVAQIALSFLLLVCGGLFIRSLRNAQNADPGFRADHVLLSSFSLFPAGYTKEKDGLAFQREVLRRVEQIPGVQSATYADWAPLGLREDNRVITPEGYLPQRNESLNMEEMLAGPKYLETMKIPLLAGRDIQSSDTPETQLVAVVNEQFAQQYWPGKNAIGRRLKIDGRWLNVVGVAKNSKYNEIDEAPQPMVYWPALQHYEESTIVLHVRVAGDPKNYAASVAAAIHSLNADLPVLDQYPLARNVEFSSTGTRIAGTFVGMFGIVGLLLAAIGIYGVIAYTTRQRLHEIGIRMALGAKRRDVFDLVLKQGMRLAAIGMTIGILGSLALTPLLRSQLYGVTSSDPVTYLCVACAMGVVVLAACFLPARRAAQVEPIRILRYE